MRIGLQLQNIFDDDRIGFDGFLINFTVADVSVLLIDLGICL